LHVDIVHPYSISRANLYKSIQIIYTPDKFSSLDILKEISFMVLNQTRNSGWRSIYTPIQLEFKGCVGKSIMN